MLASALWSQLLINWQWSVLIRTLDQDHGTSPGRRLAQIPADDTFLAGLFAGPRLHAMAHCAAILEGRAEGLGNMPAMLYQGKEAEDVAAFVAAVAGH